MTSKTTTQMKEAVESKLRAEPKLRDFPIDVFDYNGVIILQGEISSESLSMFVEDLARQVDGVVSVVNELYVKPR